MSARMLAPTGRAATRRRPAAAARAGADPAVHPAPVDGRRAGSPAGTTLHIDWTACDGRGLCTELLPDLLRRDEWGYPIALGYGSDVPVPLALHAAASDAVALCPRLALTLRRSA